MAKSIGQKSHIGIAKEATWGTPLGATDYLKFSSESLTLGIEELVSTSMQVRRIEPESYEGIGTIAGDTVHEVHPEGIGYLLHSYFNCDPHSFLHGGTIYRHTFYPGYETGEFSADCEVQPYTLEIERNTEQAFQFAGCCVNTLAFTFGVGAKILGCTASWLGKDVEKITKTSPSLEARDPFTWDQARIWVDDVEVGTLEALTMTLENGLIAIPLLNNSKRVARIVGDSFRSGTITATIDVGKDLLASWDKFVAWESRKWRITFSGASVGAQNLQLEFLFPKVVFTAYPVAIGGPGRLTVGATGKIKDNKALGYFAEVLLYNEKQSYTA